MGPERLNYTRQIGILHAGRMEKQRSTGRSNRLAAQRIEPLELGTLQIADNNPDARCVVVIRD